MYVCAYKYKYEYMKMNAYISKITDSSVRIICIINYAVEFVLNMHVCFFSQSLASIA